MKTKHVYTKDSRLYVRLKVGKKWRAVPTEYQPGQEKLAGALRERLQEKLDAGLEIMGDAGPVTVVGFYRRWIKQREQDISTWKNDEGVMRLHVLPVFGEVRISDVRPKHLVDLVVQLRKKMSGKSVWNAYSTLSAFFRDAALQDLIPTHGSPCILTKHQLGPKESAETREWRLTAQFQRSEVEQLISDERIPMDRRLSNAFKAIAGLRHSEMAKLPWKFCGLEGFTDPLTCVWVHDGKGGIDRPVPIHPTLAAMLAEWKMFGWAEMMGRKPMPEDLVLPIGPNQTHKRKQGAMRTRQYSQDRFLMDLETLGLRARRGHDLRRTMISLARSDGANKDILRRATHKPPREVVEGYTTFEWDVVCREVLKLKIARRNPAKVLPLPMAATGTSEVCYDACYGSELTMQTHLENHVGPPRTRTGKVDLGLPPTNRKQQGIAPVSVDDPSERSTKGNGLSLFNRNNVTKRLEEARAGWVSTGDQQGLVDDLTALLEMLGEVAQ